MALKTIILRETRHKDYLLCDFIYIKFLKIGKTMEMVASGWETGLTV